MKLCQLSDVRVSLHHQVKSISTDSICRSLQDSIKKKDLKACKEIYSSIVDGGIAVDTFWFDRLIHLFASFGDIQQANNVFCKVPNPTVFTWNAIISANAKLGNSKHALELYSRMQNDVSNSDKYTFLGCLKACVNEGTVKDGRFIHQDVIRAGLESDLVIGNALVNMYIKCGSLDEGYKLFENLPSHDVVTWSVVISGYVQNSNGNAALTLYLKMQQCGVKPDIVLLSCMLQACGIERNLQHGMLIHDQIVRIGDKADMVVSNNLIDMYMKCGSIKDGLSVFNNAPMKDLVSWNCVISGHAQCGNGMDAINLFEKMQSANFKPDKKTYSSIFKACACIEDLGLGISMHKRMMDSGLETDIMVKNSLIYMYSKCGGEKECLEVFNGIQHRDVVSWNAMLSGTVEHGKGALALRLFKRMRREFVIPDAVTFSSMLKACAISGALRQGRLMHDLLMRMGIEFDVILGVTLIDMYVKCDSFQDAHKLLKQPLFKNVQSWNALVAGYSSCGSCELMEQCLHQMQEVGLKPNARTYSSVLAACCHAGLVKEGKKHFEDMVRVHGIDPVTEHLNCIVDLFSRVGQLDEAEKFLQTMPINQRLSGWRSLLTSCKIHGHLDLGRECYDQAVKLDPVNGAGYVLMTNIYADEQKWTDIEAVQAQRKLACASKVPGAAQIELDDDVYEFVIGEKPHSDSIKAYSESCQIQKRIKESGYIPYVDTVLEKQEIKLKLIK